MKLICKIIGIISRDCRCRLDSKKSKLNHSGIPINVDVNVKNSLNQYVCKKDCMFNPSISACKCEFFKIIIQKRLYR